MQQLVQVSPLPNQTLAVVLSVDGASLALNLVFHYNEIADYWAMSVYDQNFNLYVDSIPLVTGNDPACNILKQFYYLVIGSCFILNTSGTNPPDYPGNSDLGTNFQIIWGDTPAAP